VSKRYFDDWIAAYMEYSSRSEAPDKFHLWTAIGTIAGALRRCIWIDMGYFEWTPNFYIIFVAPPGIVSKSTTASIGMNLLHQVPGVNFGPDAATWQALASAFSNSTELIEMPDGKSHPMSALTISSSEFGNFLNPNDREMVDLLVSMWDGQRGVWKKATKTMGDDSIENPWINLIACTTPAWIAGTFPEYMIGGGFTSRCIFVYGEEKRHLSAYPKRTLPANFTEIGQQLVHDLEIISQMRGEVTISDEGVAWGEAWYEDHYRNRPVHLSNDKLAGYLARKQTHLHKLAMVIAASKRSSLVLQRSDLEAAEALLDVIELDMPKVFERIGQTDVTRASVDISAISRTHRKITVHGLYQKFAYGMAWKDFQEALTGAVMAGWVSQRQINDTLYIFYTGDENEPPIAPLENKASEGKCDSAGTGN